MKQNYKLFLKYILFSSSNVFANNLIKNEKNLITVLPYSYFLYLATHLKLSSIFYSTQLIDLFIYETNANKNFEINNTNTTYPTISCALVYAFHNVFLNQKLAVFVPATNPFLKKEIKLNSITELFLNSGWLEREAAELHGFFFYFKKDIRNLMLPYGDSSAPMKKLFPSVGTRDLFYDSTFDVIAQTPVTLQF